MWETMKEKEEHLRAGECGVDRRLIRRCPLLIHRVQILHREVETHRFALKCTPLVLFEPEVTQESQFSDN